VRAAHRQICKLKTQRLSQALQEGHLGAILFDSGHVQFWNLDFRSSWNAQMRSSIAQMRTLE
jgi:hypothetical protein